MEQNRSTAGGYRWGLLGAAFAIMMVISIYQYSWFLFAYSLQKQFNWTLPAIGLTFTVFTYAATFIQPFSGYIADSYGPRKVALAASFLVGAGLLLASTAESTTLLYVYYGLGGIGVGILYGISAACAIKWFPDRRGFATGLVVFGFGAGTAIFNWFIQRLLETNGLQTTFVYLGIGMLLVLIPLSFFYRYPPRKAQTKKSSNTPAAPESDYRPVEMLKTHQWYLIYFSFTFTVSIVLMFGAQMKTMAKEFDLPKTYFNLLLVLFPLGNGLSRVFAGAISDKIGREKTMVIFYSLLGLSIFCFVLFADIPALFVLIVFVASLLGGAPFALYPATIGDYYGTAYSTTNYGITYTAKSFAGLISGWLSGYLVMKFGSFTPALLFIGACSLAAAVVSLPRIMKPPVKR
jgi:OFA family oxalate/formate antiporter-like MFS transporter